MLLEVPLIWWEPIGGLTLNDDRARVCLCVSWSSQVRPLKVRRSLKAVLHLTLSQSSQNSVLSCLYLAKFDIYSSTLLIRQSFFRPPFSFNLSIIVAPFCPYLDCLLFCPPYLLRPPLPPDMAAEFSQCRAPWLCSALPRCSRLPTPPSSASSPSTPHLFVLCNH